MVHDGAEVCQERAIPNRKAAVDPEWPSVSPMLSLSFSTKRGSRCFPRVIGQSQELKHHMRYLITTP